MTNLFIMFYHKLLCYLVNVLLLSDYLKQFKELDRSINMERLLISLVYTFNDFLSSSAKLLRVIPSNNHWRIYIKTPLFISPTG